MMGHRILISGRSRVFAQPLDAQERHLKIGGTVGKEDDRSYTLP